MAQRAMATLGMAPTAHPPPSSPTTCRTGPRSAAVVYLYAGLQAGASAEEVLARADADHAPFAGVEEYRAFVTEGLQRFAAPAG